MVERLSWLTEVFNSFNGTEERQQLRTAPRQQLQYTFPEQAWKRQEGYNTERGALRKLWAVPLWSQAQLIGIIGAASTTIACVTNLYDFRDDGLAFIFQPPETYQLVEITAVGGSSIDVSATLGFNNAYLMPARTAYLAGDVTRRSSGHNAIVDATYDLEDNVEVASSTPTQFLSQDLYTDEVLMDGDRYESNLFSQEDRSDNDLGIVKRLAPWIFNRRTSNHLRLFVSAAEVFAFRQFLARRAGKYRSFWQPTFEHDLRPNGTGTITTTFKWFKDSYVEWASDQVHVAFQDLTGTWYPRTLSAVSSFDSTTLQATLSSALNLPYDTLKRVSFLGSMRLSSDIVDLNWIGGGVCRVPLGVTEVAP